MKSITSLKKTKTSNLVYNCNSKQTHKQGKEASSSSVWTRRLCGEKLKKVSEFKLDLKDANIPSPHETSTIIVIEHI